MDPSWLCLCFHTDSNVNNYLYMWKTFTAHGQKINRSWADTSCMHHWNVHIQVEDKWSERQACARMQSLGLTLHFAEPSRKASSLNPVLWADWRSSFDVWMYMCNNVSMWGKHWQPETETHETICVQALLDKMISSTGFPACCTTRWACCVRDSVPKRQSFLYV